MGARFRDGGRDRDGGRLGLAWGAAALAGACFVRNDARADIESRRVQEAAAASASPYMLSASVHQ